MGYRSKDIIAKFLLYGLVAGTIGTAHYVAIIY